MRKCCSIAVIFWFASLMAFWSFKNFSFRTNLLKKRLNSTVCKSRRKWDLRLVSAHPNFYSRKSDFLLLSVCQICSDGDKGHAAKRWDTSEFFPDKLSWKLLRLTAILAICYLCSWLLSLFQTLSRSFLVFNCIYIVVVSKVPFLISWKLQSLKDV